MENVITTNQKKRRKGFTLIELIIVLAVMAIIAAIAIPNFSAVSKNSKNKADVQSAETIKRNVLMLVSDDSVQKPSTGTEVYHVKFGNNGKVSSVEKSGDGNNISVISEALQEVKKPQGIQFTYGTDGKPNHTGSKAELYYIRVTDTGDVTVNTTP